MQLGGIHAGALVAFTQLRSLDLCACQLRMWPLPFLQAGLPQLQELLLRGNPGMPFPLAPESLAACPMLLRLDLSGACNSDTCLKCWYCVGGCMESWVWVTQQAPG